MIQSLGCHHMKNRDVFFPALLRSIPIGYAQSINDTMLPDLEGTSVHSLSNCCRCGNSVAGV